MSKTLDTLSQFDDIIATCRSLFFKKHADYGSAWRILRTSSLTDQLYIKASRIRQIEEQQEQLVADSIDEEYLGLINYSIMAIIQLDLGPAKDVDMGHDDLASKYDHQTLITKNLLAAKNHDYGEIWRKMRITSITDLILMKLLRIKRIEDNDGHTVVSEGLSANYRDIINYAIFAIIKRSEIFNV